MSLKKDIRRQTGEWVDHQKVGIQMDESRLASAPPAKSRRWRDGDKAAALG
jgi:hypothetical protein